jgi:hypothetical protein
MKIRLGEVLNLLEIRVEVLFKASALVSMTAGTIGGTLSRRFGLAALAMRLRLAKASARLAGYWSGELPNWLSVPIFCARRVKATRR